LSLDERPAVAGGVTRAGDRAPDARLTDSAGAPFRLFDAFRGPHWTLLAFGGAEAPALDPRYAAAVRAHRVVRPGRSNTPDVLIDAGGDAHRTYGDGLILVRPDGYLGYTAPPGAARGLGRYLARFFG
jgi:hypothetical protein